MMTERKCTGESAASSFCEVPWVRRRRELAEMPTTHVNARAGESSDSSGRCPCCRDEVLVQLLEAQNQLLYDILGAVNGLTAAQLAGGHQD